MEALMFDAPPLLSGPLGSCGGGMDMFPPLPDDLEDLFTDDLLAFLHSAGGEVAQPPLPQQPAELPLLAHARAASSSGVVESCGSHQSEASTPSSPRSAAWEQQAAAAGPTAPAALLNALGCSNNAASASAPKVIPVCTSSGPALRLVTTITQALGGEQPAPVALLPPSSAGATTSSAARQQSSPVVSSLGSRDSDSQESHDTAHGRPAKQTRRAAAKAAVTHFSNDASSSDDDDEDEDMMDAAPGSTSCGKAAKVNKRKAPEVDWRSIEDPAERRRQRRLAKNRVTAARSRERKKVQWADLEMRMQAIENEKSQLRAMLEQFARENASLREQIAQLTGAPCGISDAVAPARTTVGMNLKGSNSTAEPAALVYIATLLLVCCFLPGDKAAMVLGSAVPLLLLAQMLQKQSSEGGLAAADGNVNGKLGSQMFEMLFRFLHLMKHLMSKSAETMRRAVHRMLYQRQYFTGRKALQQMSTLSCLPSIHSSMVARYLVKQEVLL